MKQTERERPVGGRAWMRALLMLSALVISCSLLDGTGGIDFPPVGYLYINYNNDTAFVLPVTLLAEGGEPLHGYTWSLASGEQFPTGTTVDPLTGVFRGTTPNPARVGGTFKLRVSAGSNQATSPTYRVVASNWGSGPAPWPILQQWGPNVDPSATELAEATVNKRYGASLFVTGGYPPYRWYEDLSYPGRTDLSSVGLSVHQTNGVVIGTPPASASGTTVRFRVIVTDAAGDTAVYQPVYTIRVR